MNLMKTTLLNLSLVGLMLMSGCSDMFQDKVKKQGISGSKYKAPCELDMDEFAKILEMPIKDTLKCLEANLNLFMDLAESDRPGYLSRKDLENYIKSSRADIKPEVLKAMKAVFDINFLVVGADREYISRQNVKDLIEFAILFNKEASENFKPTFQYTGETNYALHREWRDRKIAPAARQIMAGLKKIFKQNRNGQIHDLNIFGLMDAFTTDNNRASIEKYKQLLFIKKMLFGGQRHVLTHVDVQKLILNFDSFSVLALDLVRFNNIRLDQRSMVQFLKQDVELLNSLMYPTTMTSRKDELFFSISEAISALEMLTAGNKKPLKLRKYLDLIVEAKTILMGGSKEFVTGLDFKNLLQHATTLLDTGVYFHRFWDSKRGVLESYRPISENLQDLKLQFPEHKQKVDDFVRIVSNYRFFKGEYESAFYSYDYRRNANAVYEIALYEYALKLVFKKYGCPETIISTSEGDVPCDADRAPDGLFGAKRPNETEAEYQERIRSKFVYMKTDHVLGLIKRLRSILIEMDIIYPGRETKTAETVTLLGSLFQYQSDENKVFDVNEATEFAVSLFSAIDLSDNLHSFYKTKNGCKWDFKKSRVDPQCFKKHYWEGVCRAFPNQYPKLFESLGATVWEKDPVTNVRKLVCRIPENAANSAYLERAIKAARTCNNYPDGDKEEIYYSKGDMMSIFLAMTHIETTVLRWDMNLNNVMDPNEVMDAYSIYSPALDGFLEGKSPLIKRFKKQIYQYLLKYEEVPNEKQFSSIRKFIWFLIRNTGATTANRKSIASVLVAIGEQGSPNLFDCSYMRNPDRIPRDYDPEGAATPSPEKGTDYSYLLEPYLHLAD